VLVGGKEPVGLHGGTSGWTSTSPYEQRALIADGQRTDHAVEPVPPGDPDGGVVEPVQVGPTTFSWPSTA
jgi:hypothetical protein